MYMGCFAHLLSNSTDVLVRALNYFSNFPSIEKEGNLCFKKEKYMEKKRRRPHVGNCAMVRQERHLTTEDSTPPRHPATSRHLRYSNFRNYAPPLFLP